MDSDHICPSRPDFAHSVTTKIYLGLTPFSFHASEHAVNYAKTGGNFPHWMAFSRLDLSCIYQFYYSTLIVQKYDAQTSGENDSTRNDGLCSSAELGAYIEPISETARRCLHNEVKRFSEDSINGRPIDL